MSIAICPPLLGALGPITLICVLTLKDSVSATSSNKLRTGYLKQILLNSYCICLDRKAKMQKHTRKEKQENAEPVSVADSNAK